MKYSRFNILLDKGTYFLAYNTLSKAMVRIKKEDFSIENSAPASSLFCIKETYTPNNRRFS